MEAETAAACDVGCADIAEEAASSDWLALLLKKSIPRLEFSKSIVGILDPNPSNPVVLMGTSGPAVTLLFASIGAPMPPEKLLLLPPLLATCIPPALLLNGLAIALPLLPMLLTPLPMPFTLLPVEDIPCSMLFPMPAVLFGMLPKVVLGCGPLMKLDMSGNMGVA
jgi:hypothetical protein